MHRHDAQAVVYVLEGSIVMHVRGGAPVTLLPGQTFYEGQHERLGGRSARPTARRLFAGQVALSLEILFGSIKR